MFIINTCKDLNEDIFNELSSNIIFEHVTNGRLGAILISNENKTKNIVRTTTNYNNPVQYFLPIHYNIIKCIQKEIPFDIQFNNAMIEIYDNTYTKMKYHTDQYLDLDDNSYICIYSCYQYPTKYPRKLVIKEKNQQCIQEILLQNNVFVPV